MMTAARTRIFVAGAALITVGVLAVALVALRPMLATAGSPAADSPSARPAAVGYSLSTLGNQGDGSYNRLLGINNLGHIAGYFGSGAAGHPNKAYILRPPYRLARYQSIDFPGSWQTQLAGLNDEGVQVGFWSTQNNASQVSNSGFYLMGGRFSAVSFPAGDQASPPVNQLLGVNDHDIAVGFYTDSQGNKHAYRYDIGTKDFSSVAVPGGSSVIAAAINDPGGVAGFFTTPKGVTSGFFLQRAGHLFILNVPHATMTQALGVNDSGEVVGDYRIGRGSSVTTHGFTWTRQHGFTTVDDPRGAGATTISGINNAGDLVGFYVDGAGHTDGLMATPTAAAQGN